MNCGDKTRKCKEKIQRLGGNPPIDNDVTFAPSLKKDIDKNEITPSKSDAVVFTDTVITKSGKKMDLHIEIKDAKIGGVATCEGVQYPITDYGAIHKRGKILTVRVPPKNTTANVLISEKLYKQISETMKAQYNAAKSQEDKDWDNVCELELVYKKLLNNSDSYVDIIKARDDYENALDQFAIKYPNSFRLKSNRVSYNVKEEINIWTN